MTDARCSGTSNSRCYANQHIGSTETLVLEAIVSMMGHVMASNHWGENNETAVIQSPK
jgi:hypothetical protein